MNLYATFDRSEFPVISIHFTGEKETKENFQLYLDELRNNYERKEEFALIFELTNAPIPNVKYQLKQAAWMKENENLIKRYCRGVAYVIPGALMRNVLKFIFTVQQNPVEFKVFSTYAESQAWAKSLVSA
ncbi:MAG: hypothetical protein ACJAZY_001683 [Spirosomataceae bacterium]|jgi:hypothetical protein